MHMQITFLSSYLQVHKKRAMRLVMHDSNLHLSIVVLKRSNQLCDCIHFLRTSTVYFISTVFLYLLFFLCLLLLTICFISTFLIVYSTVIILYLLYFNFKVDIYIFFSCSICYLFLFIYCVSSSK